MNWLIIRIVIGFIVQNLEDKVLLYARYSYNLLTTTIGPLVNALHSTSLASHYPEKTWSHISQILLVNSQTQNYSVAQTNFT